VDSGAPRVKHAFDAEGVYRVTLEVTDLLGRTARADGQLTVRPGAPACAEDAECQDVDRCLDGRCSGLWGPACPAAPDAGPTCSGCQVDADCPAGFACRAGACASAP
jgi:Cys-rich repeat protein